MKKKEQEQEYQFVIDHREIDIITSLSMILGVPAEYHSYSGGTFFDYYTRKSLVSYHPQDREIKLVDWDWDNKITLQIEGICYRYGLVVGDYLSQTEYDKLDKLINKKEKTN